MAEEQDDKREEGAFGDLCGSDKDEEEETAFDFTDMEQLRKLFAQKLGVGSSKEDSAGEKILEEMSLKGVAKFIQSEQCKNVVVMCGAGVSTSAGIPDFRSPGSGLYDNLQQFNLPDPQAIFEIEFFKTNPLPFYTLAKQLLPVGYKPTPCHYFIRLLHEQGKLLRVYTQNIDTLERMCGIPEEKIVEAHGTFHTSHCLKSTCKKAFSLDWMRDHISQDVPKCPDCGSYIKPDIVFFGESLPSRFFELSRTDFPHCDLLIVLGTSLVVQPFASLVDRVGKNTPRLLINKEKVGSAESFMSFLGLASGLQYDSDKNYRDVAWIGLCDEGCQSLADELGWGKDLEQLIKTEHEQFDEIEKQKKKEEEKVEEAKEAEKPQEEEKVERQREWL